MVEMAKVQINWSGFAGSPGYTNLYFREGDFGDVDQGIVDGVVGKTDTWCSSLASRIPTGASIQVQPMVEIVESTTGVLQRFMTATTAPTLRAGSSAGNYSAASGACVNWYTNGVRNGRRIRGRTFIVPLGGASLDTNGTINDTQLTGLRTATTGLIAPSTTGDLGVWSRPSLPGAADGQWHAVTSYTIPDKVAVLRSRRD